MTITFKALAALLGYPTPELVAALPEIIDVINAEPRAHAAQPCARAKTAARAR
jgi:hypothetical protein